MVEHASLYLSLSVLADALSRSSRKPLFACSKNRSKIWRRSMRRSGPDTAGGSITPQERAKILSRLSSSAPFLPK